MAGSPPGRVLRSALTLAGVGCILAAAASVQLNMEPSGLWRAPLALALLGFAILLARDWLTSDSADRTREALQLLAVGGLLALVMLVVAEWRIEGPAFYERLAPVIFFGFLLHHALPRRWRPTFFLLLSLGGLVAVFGVPNAAWMTLVGLALIGLCHLPVRLSVRIGLLTIAGLGLGLMRGGVLAAPWPSVIWPILASLFMFRLIVYMYDLRFGNIPDSWAQRLSYFFLLPNPVFPLFPVVDSQTYHRSYYAGKTGAIYLRGVEWMSRGILQLVLYRFIYQQLAISAVEVATGGDLARYLLTNFGLYLRVSGQFHLIVGILHLFGHALPQTNNLYFLSSSFSDFWRRVNIYWKDFMQKVVFYPIFMRIRKWRLGETAAVLAATLVVFFATWFLHSYQWFWILGQWLISGPDILFWSILAVLLMANTLWERKRGPQRRLGRALSFRERGGLALRTVGVFSVICLLWGLWNSPTVGDFVRLFRVVDWTGLDWVLWLLAFIGFGGLVVTAGNAFGASKWRFEGNRSGFVSQTLVAGVALLALWVVVQPQVTERLSLEAQVAFRPIRRGELSARDAELMRRGYYENLVGVGRLNSRVWEVMSGRPDDWKFISFTEAGRLTYDFREKELLPNAQIVFHGASFETNQWGLRDREYEKEPAPGTYRIAVLGASYLLGSGVGTGENFESLVEERLNEKLPTGYERYELLNFGVPGYEPLRQVFMASRAFDFQPDALWFFTYGGDDVAAVKHLAWAMERGFELPDPYLQDLAARAGVTAGMPEAEGEQRLLPHRTELIEWAYRRIAEQCEARGVQPVWIFLPGTDSPSPELFYSEQVPVAEKLGFRTLDLSRVYRGADMEDIVVAPFDGHPNPLGHQIIADSLYRLLSERPELLRADAEGRTPAN